MRTLEEKIRRFTQVQQALKNMPPNEELKVVEKRISDIRDLLIKADVAMESGKSPTTFFNRTDDVLDDIDNLTNQKQDGKTT